MDEQDAIDVAFEALQARGPALGRPRADTVTGSRHANMKELRPPGETIRILFAFDPRRTAILLIGGKRYRWIDWYEEFIPIAVRLYGGVSGAAAAGGKTVMSSHENYRVLRQRLEARVKDNPEARFRREERRRALRDALRLAELRESCGKTQTQVAETLGVSQPSISQVEHKEDLYVSTLRDYVEALGGRLEINAVFPDKTVSLAVPGASDLKTAEPLDEM